MKRQLITFFGDLRSVHRRSLVERLANRYNRHVWRTVLLDCLGSDAIRVEVSKPCP